MRTDTLATLFLEEIHDVRSVEQQIVDALNGIAKGVSVRGLSQAAVRILEATEKHMARLDRIMREIGPDRDDDTAFSPRSRRAYEASSTAPRPSFREFPVELQPALPRGSRFYASSRRATRTSRLRPSSRSASRRSKSTGSA